MISKIVEEQLKNCSFAKPASYNEATHTFYIPKYTKPKYTVNHAYLVIVAGSLVNNPNSVLATNWNNGRYPTHNCYKIYVSKILGTYIYCDGLAFDMEANKDLNTMFSGWFSMEDLTQIAEIQ